jgi:hypothetical protein
MAIHGAIKKRTFTIRADGITGQQILLVDYDTIEADLTAERIVIGASFPGLSAVRCRNIQCESFGKNTATGYEFYKVTADYSTGEAPQRQEVGHIEEWVEYDVQELVRPGGNIKLTDEEIEAATTAMGQEVSGQLGQELSKVVLREDEAPMILCPIKTYGMRIVTADYYAYDQKLTNIVGRVNSDKHRKARPESLLCQAPSSEKFWDAQGNELWKMTIRVSYSGEEHTWNERFLRGKWRKPEYDANPKTLYEKVPFAPLLKP